MPRRLIFQAHLWIGVATGLYIFVVCVSGAALVFRIDMQRALYPDLFTPGAAGPLADPVDVMESVHFDLLGGRTGRLVNGAGALCLVVMCLTGAVIWWPGRTNWRRSLRVDFTRQWKRVNWDLHSAVGFWSVVFILMWAVTGVYFAFPSAFRSMVNRLSPVTVTRAPQSNPRAGAPIPTWRELMDQARRHAPGQHVARVVLPFDDKAAFLVMFSNVRPAPPGADLTPVYLDQYTGALLTDAAPSARTAGDVILAWVAPLHVGNFAGNGVRVVWLVLGLAPPLLFVTGFTMWWTRVVRPRWLRASARGGDLGFER